MNKFWEQAYPVAWWKPRIKKLEQRIKELEAELLHENDLFLTWRDKAETRQVRIAQLKAQLEAMEQAYKEGITYGQYKAALGGDDEDI